MLPTRLRRFSYAVAALLLAAAVFNVRWLPTPDWYASTVIEAGTIAAIGLFALFVALEIAAKFAPTLRSQWFVFVFAAVAVLMVAGYVFTGAWFGRGNARVDTWHLLSLFTIVQFVLAIVAAAAIVGIIALVAHGVRRSRGSTA
jgi:hypothetical protein